MPGPISQTWMPVLQENMTHIAVVVRSQAEFDYQLAAFQNYGIGPWLPAPLRLNVTGYYCGQTIQFTCTIQLTTDYRNREKHYYEIFNLLNDYNDPTFFSDFYDVHGPSLLYFGQVPNYGSTTYQDVRAHWAQQGIVPFFGWESATSYVDWVRIGYTFAEVVTPKVPVARNMPDAMSEIMRTRFIQAPEQQVVMQK